MVLALMLMMAQATASTVEPAIVNGDFETRDDRDRPTGWRITRRGGGDPGVALTTIDGPSGRAAHIDARGIPGSAYTRVQEVIDATPWRGRIVRLSARMRVVEPGGHIGLRLSVSRQAPYASGFYSHMADRPVGAGDWREVAMIAYVDEDATTIDLGALAQGNAVFDIDDIALDTVKPDGAPPSQDALAYLERAIRFAKMAHTDTARIDWPKLEARSRAMIAGAKTPRDTYPAIQAMIGTLGDIHSHLQPPIPARVADAPAGKGTPPAPPMPNYALLDGRYGMIALPGLSFDPRTERWIGARYVGAIRDGLRAADAAPLCGWIVDLRANTGGNMWPMVNALSPLLGDGPFGAFVSEGKAIPWVRETGFVTIKGAGAGMGLGPEMAPIAIRKGQLPVAVLLGPETASSGEMTALALIGRPGVRTFGTPTAGYISANSTQRMPDGAVLAIQSSWSRDRTGREYRERIMPDEPSATPLAAARAWLTRSCGK